MKPLHLAILSIVFISTFFSCKQENDQPNIVVILCDDLGYGDLSSYGHSIIQTPNLDGLAAKGIKLTNYYSAAPVCSPSRVGLLTGRSPNKAGVYDFIPGPKKSEDNRDLVHLQEHESTIPAMLKEVGYATCLSGKWHCNSKFNSDAQPRPDHFGFDHWFATHNNAAPSHENPKNFVRNGEDVGEIEGFSCQIVVDEAIQWLTAKKGEKPFYLQVCFHEPHEPIASPKNLVDKYLSDSENENQAQYFANVENMDKAVGRLVEFLEQNHGENTLIVFSSDNGPETLNRYSRAKRSYGSPGALKGMKLWTTEAGFRVPGIVYWMGNAAFQGTSDAVVSGLDFLPTFAELSGASLPQRTIDGESFSPLIKKGEFVRSKPLIWSFYNALNDHMVAMRDGDWKMMAMLKNDTTYLPKINNLYDGNEAFVKEAELTDFVLFNMKNDKSETENVASKYPEVFEEEKKRLKEEYAKLLADSHIWKRN
ncbi:sulfatase family protein [Flexithrix dorotheae]|uniref:sulfatase family protein n=1 Tax=Flexithrix dorotheae TaxID=70993 RepID=UPI00035FC90E|nr:sulfatase-like hydrolase/transferase [Flexithrix dorotheae]